VFHAVVIQDKVFAGGTFAHSELLKTSPLSVTNLVFGLKICS